MLNKKLFKNPNLAPENLHRGLVQPAGLPETACPRCNRRVSSEQLAKAFWVCPHCGLYHKVSARARIALTLDYNSFEEMDKDYASQDPLRFPGYQDKLAQARRQSGEQEGVVTGTGRVDGIPCAFFAMEPGFMMGSMGTAVGEKITRLFEHALRHRLSVLGFTLSGGARVQEGILSLMQMAKVSGAVREHSDAGLFYLAVLCDPTTGGVAASFAMQADIILAEPGALTGFAGPRVIEQTTRQKLPEGFQRAEFQLEHGFVNRICPREGQKSLIAQLLRLHVPPEDA